jgi:NTE family protein
MQNNVLRRVFLVFIAFIAGSGFFSVNLHAENIETVQRDTVRVGLVLSGGGALGIAHIGILEALEEAGVRIDYITGTSMGSLVGGLYSIGYTIAQLSEIAISNNFIDLFTESRDRRYISNYEKLIEDRTIASFPINEKRIDLPLGIISGQNVYTFLSRLAWNVHGTEDFNLFPIPFAAVATDIETGEAKVFRSGYLPDALRASISIPSALSPHPIGDKVYIDGGLIRNIPVQDAIEMGATYTIAVDVSTPLLPKDSLNTLAAILNQSIIYRIQDYNVIQKELADYVIEVEELQPYSPADFDKAELFLEIGRRYGQKHLDKFREIAAMQSYPPPPRPGVGETGALPVNEVIINGNTLVDDEFILRLLDFTPGVSMNPDIIEEKVTRLYSSQYIDHVTYRIRPNDDYFYNLEITIVENTTDEFNVGLRYESGTQASLLLESTFRDLLHRGSLSRFETRLGDRLNFIADHVYYGALGSRFALLSSIQFFTEDVDWFLDGDGVSRFKNEILRAEIAAGNYFSTQNLFTFGVRKDFNNHTNKINKEFIGASSKNYHAVYVRFIRDNLNRRGYPTSGKKLVLEGFLSDELLFSPVNFTASQLYYNGIYPVHRNISFTNTFWFSYTTGRELPWQYWASPNRFDHTIDYTRFAGARRFELTTRNIQMGSIGIQFEPFRHRFIGFDFYAGRFLDNWNLNISDNDFEFAGSVSVGAQSIFGPLKLIMSTSTLHTFRAELQLGYHF